MYHQATLRVLSVRLSVCPSPASNLRRYHFPPLRSQRFLCHFLPWFSFFSDPSSPFVFPSIPFLFPQSSVGGLGSVISYPVSDGRPQPISGRVPTAHQSQPPLPSPIPAPLVSFSFSFSSFFLSFSLSLEAIFNVMRSINPRFTYLLTYLLSYLLPPGENNANTDIALAEVCGL